MKKRIVKIVALLILLAGLALFLYERSNDRDNTAKSLSVSPKTDNSAPENIKENGQENAFQILDAPILDDQRKQLLPGSYDSSMCRADFNIDLENAYVKYESKKRGIFFQVPYYYKWGNADFYLPPYVELIENGSAKLLFGNLNIAFEGGCGLGRRLTLTFLPSKSLDQEIADVEAWISGSEGKKTTKTIKKILNGLDVIEFDMIGQELGCTTQPSIRIIGEAHNYWLFGDCNGPSLEDLENIVKTMKLIK